MIINSVKLLCLTGFIVFGQEFSKLAMDTIDRLQLKVDRLITYKVSDMDCCWLFN